MNERIRELGRQAGFAFIEDGVYGRRWYSSKCGMDASEFEKFAELIVAECIKEITDQMFYEGIDESNNPGYYKAINRVEEHFGVEE
jgi:hypothetical protein